jgi:choline dehydrogenase
VSDYDYVIVGAGSAGCVLADRLSADGAEVLLVEAGGRNLSPKIKIPAAFAQQFQTKLDWNHSTGPEPGCADRELFVPRGKCLGGSSSMNAMLYVRGHRADYDAWRDDAGCGGWGWDEVLPYFMRSEHHEEGTSATHAAGGQLNVAAPRSPRKLTDLMIGAACEHGFPFDPDYNDGNPAGACVAEVTQKRGRRWSAADAFLKPAAGRSNLTVARRTGAIGLELKGGRAQGVKLTGNLPFAVARARREVILAAGTIGSPQLLMLSGIGAPAHLRELGIESQVDLAGVGQNLQDHPYVVCIWESRIGQSLLDAEKPSAALEFLIGGRGPLTSSVCEGFIFARSDGADGPPDLQFHLAPAFFSDNGFEDHESHAFTMGPVLIAPRARGELRLRSSDPTVKPHLVGNHLTDPDDVAAMLAGVKLSRELAATEPLAGATGTEIYPGTRIAADDDEALVADIRRRCELLYHPVGTCRMGDDDEAVVDPELRVNGVEALRVVDASVMPTITRGNTNAPTIMIAEKAADLILGRAAPQPLAVSV